MYIFHNQKENVKYKHDFSDYIVYLFFISASLLQNNLLSYRYKIINSLL